MIMDKSKSYPDYMSSSYSGEFGFEDRSKAYTFNGPSNKGQGLAVSTDSELKRKKRIAAYNMFTTEGKLKSTVKESFKWIKNKFTGDIRLDTTKTVTCGWVFDIFVRIEIVDMEACANVIDWIGGNTIVVYQDYIVLMDGVGKGELFVTLRPLSGGAILNGLELLKLGNPDNNLADHNTEIPSRTPKGRNTALVLIGGNPVGMAAIIFLSGLLAI